MPLLKDGHIVDDAWTTVDDGAELPAGEPAVVSLDRWKAERESLSARNAPLGVRLRADQFPDDIAADLGRFQVISLEFPTFKDGRAYSHARRLRERFGYAGELRAVGNVLRDQWAFMARCGFDAFEVEGADAEAAWAEAEAEISVAYQPATDRRPWAAALRREAGRVS